MSSKSRSKSSSGGRSHFRGSRDKSGKSKSQFGYKSSSNSRKELRFTPLDSRMSSPQATFVTVMEALETEVLKTFEKGAKDVADSLVAEELLAPVRPTMARSTHEDAAIRARENTEHELDYSDQIKRHNKRMEALEQGMVRAYGIIWSDYLSTSMIERIERHPDYLTRIKGNAIELIKAVKSCMHETTRSQKPILNAIQALTKLFNYKQQDGMTLSEYIKGFKEHRDVLKTQLGEHMFDYFAEQQTPGYANMPPANQSAAKAGMLDEVLGVLFLLNSDQRKYGSIKTDLSAAFTRGRDEYPQSLRRATDMLDTHTLDQSYKDHRKRQAIDKGDKREKTEKNFAQKNDGPVVCYCCGAKNHKSNSCRFEKKVPKAEWHHKTGKVPPQVLQAKSSNASHAQTEDSGDESGVSDNETDDDSSVASSRSSRSRRSNRRSGRSSSRSRSDGWSNFMIGAKQYHQADAEGLRDIIILDSGSTIGATIMNPDLITNLRKSKKTLRMSTNAGTKDIKLEGEVINFGKAWYDPSMMTNIFSLSGMADKHRVEYDSSKEDAFKIHTPDGIIKFSRTPEGLYAYKPSAKYKKAVAMTKNPVTYTQVETLEQHHVTTVKENMTGFTKREVDGAKLARKVYRALGCPSLESFKHALRTNLIKNCPVTTQDAINAEHIFGPDVGAIKGKTTRKPPPVVRDDHIEIPDEIKNRDNLTLCMDIMYVWGLPTLTAVDKTIRYRSAEPLDDRTTKSLYSSLDVILREYNKAGHTITSIHCDREFRRMMNPVSDELDVEMNYTNTDDHVPEAERNNRVLKERVRALANSLPFKKMPKVMIRKAVQHSARQLNLFPAKGGVSKYLSPYTIMHGKSVDYDKELKVPFGAYVQATKEAKPYNTPETRTIAAICLGPTNNKQGGYDLMAVTTGRLITRARVIELPMTDLIIEAVEDLAEAQGIKELKFHARDGAPADWIAGVDSDSDSDSDSNSSDSDSDSDSDDDDDDPPDLLVPKDSDSDSDSSSESDSESDDDDDGYMDRIDREEVDDLLADSIRWEKEQSNPISSEEFEAQTEAETLLDEPSEAQPTEISVSDLESQAPEPEFRRSTRERQAPERFDPGKGMNQTKATKSVKFKDHDILQDLEQCHNLMGKESIDGSNTIEYNADIAGVAARYIHDLNEMAMMQGVSLGQQYILQKGLKVFGDRGKEAGRKEIGQLHDRQCFNPILVSELNEKEKKKALEALMFLTEKRDGSVKGRMVANGKPTRDWHTREEAASPTASLESIFLTAAIDAKEGRDVMTADIPNAFIQASIPALKPGEDRVVMKLTGLLLDLLVEQAPQLYGPYVVMENGKRVLYLEVLRALYGMLVAALLWYRKFREDLESQGFVFNPYDPCVANRWVDHKRHTVRFHVDDLMSSHIDPKVNDKFLVWLNDMYGKHGEVKATRGRIHDYLGMTFEFTESKKLIVSMADYIKRLVDEFPVKITKTAPTPAAEDLFAEGKGPKLDKKQSETLHTWVAKALFACKRARPDIHTATTLLCTRVRAPNQDDWKKLIRLLEYLNGSREDVLTLGVDDVSVLKWYVDASFAVHPDFKSHTGACVTYGTGAPINMSRKQKLNTRSSTEAELVATDDAVNMILWTKLFLEEQGYNISQNILYQDNKSAILLEKNGKKSSSKRTRALNIRYFYLTDQAEKGNVLIEYCPTGEMIADYMTKPLQGQQFEKFKSLIMGMEGL
jgi:hypothetical protein